MKFHPMPVLTILTLISLAILVQLGNWQYGRYTGKMASASADRLAPNAEAISVHVDTLNPGMAQQVYGAIDGEPVWRRYVPARLSESGDLVLVLWDATGGPVSVPLAIADATGPYQRVANRFKRDAERGRFAAADSPSTNEWFTFDADAMARNLGYALETDIDVVETLDVTVRNSRELSQARRTVNPYASETLLDPLPPERHFGYALTWWGMAIGLLGVYLALHYSQGRLRFRS